MTKSFFTKKEIIRRSDEILAAFGSDQMRADFNLALIILGSSLPDFARKHSEFKKSPERLEFLLKKYSSHPST